jgi:hypothetical protein
VEPEVVATSPNRCKNPVPVCCGFDSLKNLTEANGGNEDRQMSWLEKILLRYLCYLLFKNWSACWVTRQKLEIASPSIKLLFVSQARLIPVPGYSPHLSATAGPCWH